MIDIIKADRIHGMMPASYLYFLAKEASKCRSVVEVGSWRGRTTRAICDNCPGEVFAVDTWRGSEELVYEMTFMQDLTGDSDWLFHEFCENLKDCQNLRLVRSNSLEAAEKFSAIGKQFDMVFLDAAHDYESTKADILAWYPLVSPGGYLFGDDYSFEPTRQAVADTLGDVECQELKGCRLWGVPSKSKVEELV